MPRASAWRPAARRRYFTAASVYADGSSELQAKLGTKLLSSGVKIFTTFDLWRRMPQKSRCRRHLALKKQRKLSDLETAMVVVIVLAARCAMVGGAEPQYAGYNRTAQARRSIGSLAKPATYLTALSQPNPYTV